MATETVQAEGNCNLIVILGTNASGKTRTAVRLAAERGSEVISADSRQVYRGMDLGTGKDLEEFTVAGKGIPYHLIDICDPGHEFNVFEYQQRFYRTFSDLSRRGIIPVMVGGTGLYIEAVVRGYDMVAVPEDPLLRERLHTKDMDELGRYLHTVNPTVHNTTDLGDRGRLLRAIEIAEYSAAHRDDAREDRPVVHPFVMGIRWPRDLLRKRIAARLLDRLDRGMIDEVKRLRAVGIDWERLDSFGLEYRYISLYLRGELAYDDMVDTLTTKIGQFAKRQETWFRRMEKRGTAIHWVDGDNYPAVRGLVERHVGVDGNHQDRQ